MKGNEVSSCARGETSESISKVCHAESKDTHHLTTEGAAVTTTHLFLVPATLITYHKLSLQVNTARLKIQQQGHQHPSNTSLKQACKEMKWQTPS